MPPSTTYRSPDELAADPLFIRWVQAPTPQTDAFWREWLAEDDQRRALAEQARQLIELMQFQPVPLDLTDRQRLEATHSISNLIWPTV